VYVYQPNCPPRYRVGTNAWYSSWDGWTKWRTMWNGPLVRYKSPPPVGYVPPDKYREAVPGRTPPGYLGGWRAGAEPTPVGRYRGLGMRVRDNTSVMRNGERVPLREPPSGRMTPSERTAERPHGDLGRGETEERPPGHTIERREGASRPNPPAPRDAPRTEKPAEKPKDAPAQQPPPRIEVPRQAAPGRSAGGGGDGSGNRFRK
jgi:hypothetical protein